MAMLQEWLVRFKLGRCALEVETDPSQIAGRIRDQSRRNTWTAINNSKTLPKFAKSGINKLLRETRRFDVADDSKFDLVPFEHGKTYQIMSDVWNHKDRLEDSLTYRQIHGSLMADGLFRHKKYVITQQAEIVQLIQSCYCELLTSMDEEGYLPDKRSDFATGGMGLAIVWRDGRLWHDEGATHRLVAARLTGLRRGFPLRIVAAHRDWLREQGIRSLSEMSELPKVLQSVTGVLSTHLRDHDQ